MLNLDLLVDHPSIFSDSPAIPEEDPLLQQDFAESSNKKVTHFHSNATP